MDRPHDVGPGHVEDLVAALVALEVVQRRVPGLQHRAHGPVGDDDPLGAGSTESRGVRRHACGGSIAGQPTETRRRTLKRPAGEPAVPDRGEVAPVIEHRRLPGADRPVDHRGLRGVERRRRRRHLGRRAPRGGLGSRGARRDGPRGLLRLPGQPPTVGMADDGPPRSLAHHQAVLRAGCPTWSRHRADPRHRAQHAVEAVHRRDPRRMPRARRRDGGHARRPAGRLAAHPAGAGDRHLVGPGGRPSRCTSSRRGTRGRPASSVSCRTPAPRPACRRCRFWAAVPHYVAQPPCPKATLALLRHIEDLLDVPIPLGELPEDARAWERGVDELAAEDSEVADYVRSLEEAKDLTDAAGGVRRRDRPRVRALPAPPHERRPDGSPVAAAVILATPSIGRLHQSGSPSRPPGATSAGPAHRAAAPPLDPCVHDRGQRAWASRSSASGARSAVTGRVVIRPPVRRPPPDCQPLLSRPSNPSASTPSRRGSAGRAGPAGSPSGPPRPRSRETRTRFPSDFDILWPS